MKNFFATYSKMPATAVISGTVILVALLGSWTLVRAEGGTISICVKSNGKVTVGTACSTGDNLLTWNVQGPQGEPGLQGDPGSAGPQGEQGPAGSFGSTSRYVTTTDTRIPPSTEWGGATTGYAFCDSGDTLVSGGAKSNFDGVRILGNFPFGTAAWRGDVSNQGPVEKILTVFALCEDTTP